MPSLSPLLIITHLSCIVLPSFDLSVYRPNNLVVLWEALYKCRDTISRYNTIVWRHKADHSSLVQMIILYICCILGQSFHRNWRPCCSWSMATYRRLLVFVQPMVHSVHAEFSWRPVNTETSRLSCNSTLQKVAQQWGETQKCWGQLLVLLYFDLVLRLLHLFSTIMQSQVFIYIAPLCSHKSSIQGTTLQNLALSYFL